MIDLHTHVLHGLDDGAASLEESLAIARAAVADGIEALAGTPHVRGDYPTSADEMEARLAEVRAAVEAEGLPLRVLGGGEVALDVFDGLSQEELRRFGLGGNPRCVLLEFPYVGWPLSLETIVRELVADGIVPVIAHPERSGDVQRAPERLAPLVASGALVQLTAGSLEGAFGRRAQAAATALLDRGLAHLVASDTHGARVRASGLSGAVAALGDDATAAWLVHSVPAALVAGEPPPPRPPRAVAERRRWWQRRRD